MFVVAAVVSFLLLGTVTLAVRLMARPDPVVVGLVLLANGFFCAGVLLWPVVIASVLLTFAFWVWPPRPGQRRAFHLASVSAVAAGFLVVAPVVWPEQREFARLRERYPFETMADRLTPKPAGTPPAFDANALEQAEDEYEDRWRRDANWFNGRNLILQRLHEDQVELFVNSPGFGVVRTVRGRPTANNLGEPRPLEPTSDPPLDLMVREDVRDFADPARWGYRRGSEVAGFLPHALRRQPGPAMGWAVERVELVGLLLAPDPRVYVSESLPRMTELAGATTRHPDGFESPALARLRAGDELVLDEPVGRLLGAIRAAKQCLACHGGDRGDLLGAFSYHLRRR